MRSVTSLLAFAALAAGSLLAPASATDASSGVPLEPVGWQLAVAPGVAPRLVPTGSDWSSVGTGVGGSADAIAVASDGTVYVGGTFQTAGGVPAQYVAKWDGTAWTSLGDANDWVFTLTLGVNDVLFAGGRFTRIGGVDATRIAYFDPDTQTWGAIGVGFNNPVEAIVEGPDGCLYAAGGFRIVGDVSGQNIARTCVENVWEYVGGGTDNTVYTLAFDDEGALYAGGAFNSAGGTTARQVARFDPTTALWGGVGDGVTQSGGGPVVYALAFSPDGDLYVGGAFNEIGGLAANNLARWDGAEWSSVGGGVSGTTGGSTAVAALVFDGGGNLYVGGSFTEAGSVTVNSVARWDGSAWAGLGGGVVNGRVETLVIAFPYLYAGGGFSDMDGDATLDFIAKWEGVVNVASEPGGAGPAEIVLEPAFPNPFRDEATIRFTTARPQPVRLDVFDVLGRRVAVLYEGTTAAGQPVEVRVDGRGFPAGLYIARLSGPDLRLTRRLSLVR